MSLPDDDGPGLLANVSSGDNSPPLSVSEISGALKRTVEQNFSNVRVRGEISGWKRHSSGHCYFTLKDDKSNLDGVLWRGQAARLKFEPEDGVEVIASGRLSTYGARSKYQMVVSSLELAGEGALMALLDKRRRALAAEGLFDESRKRALPFLPKTIGVVSSPTGAVIRDILHRLADRCPSHVILWPVPVQGEGASAKIAAAIRGFADHQPRPDLLIVARGGGSIEDLWAFNEEEVVRAASDSPIPLISAVGHETDTTLIDFASDRRAPTPTAAAEMAVPVLAELSAFIDSQSERATQALSRRIELASERIDQLRERWPQPDALFEPIERRLAEPVARLPRALAGRASEARADFATIAGRLRPALVSERVANAGERLASLWRLAGLAHPERPLQRGFVRVTDREGNTLVHAADARSAGRLSLRFADGSLGATVDGSAAALERAAPKSYRPRRKAGPKGEGQPGLFDDEE